MQKNSQKVDSKKLGLNALKTWFVLLIVIPLLLVVYYVPQLNESFILHLEKPTVFSVFLSSFAHKDGVHLKDNILNYVGITLWVCLGGMYTNDKIFNKFLTYPNDKILKYLIPIGIGIFFSLLVFFFILLWPNKPQMNMGYSTVVNSFFGYGAVLFARYILTKEIFQKCQSILKFSIGLLIIVFIGGLVHNSISSFSNLAHALGYLSGVSIGWFSWQKNS